MKPILFFLHIPKTAGTSLYQIFAQQYPGARLVTAYPPFAEGALEEAAVALRNGAEVFYGHMNFGVHRLLGVPGRYLSMLRHPVDRVVSYFNHQRTHPHAEHHALLSSGIDLQEFVSRRVTCETNNHMTRMLAGYAGTGHLDDRRILEQALRHLREDFVCAGVTEHFNESVAVMAECLGWDFGQPRLMPRANAAPPTDRIALEPHTRRLIERENALDLALYRAVAEDLEHRIHKRRARTRDRDAQEER